MIPEIYEQASFLQKFHFQPEGSPPVNSFCASVSRMPIHMHDGMELICVLSGEVKMKISFNEYVLSAGDFLFVNTFEVHSIDGKTENKVLFLQMDKELFAGALYAFDPYFYRNFNPGKVAEAVELMRTICLENEDEVRLEMAGRLAKICDRYFQMQAFDPNNRRSGAFAGHEINDDRMRDSYWYMYTRYDEKMNLSDFAGRQHIDSAYTSRLLKEGMGKGFKEMINTVRVDRAEVFLLGTNIPVQEISERLRFSSPYYFNKIFRQYFHTTPAAYRNKWSQKTYPVERMDFRLCSLREERWEEELQAVLRRLSSLSEGEELTGDGVRIRRKGNRFEIFGEGKNTTLIFEK